MTDALNTPATNRPINPEHVAAFKAFAETLLGVTITWQDARHDEYGFPKDGDWLVTGTFDANTFRGIEAMMTTVTLCANYEFIVDEDDAEILDEVILDIKLDAGDEDTLFFDLDNLDEFVSASSFEEALTALKTVLRNHKIGNWEAY